jgi:hypothetical protein
MASEAPTCLLVRRRCFGVCQVGPQVDARDSVLARQRPRGGVGTAGDGIPYRCGAAHGVLQPVAAKVQHRGVEHLQARAQGISAGPLWDFT